jgi:hypoxanthine-DNA glycosylase
MQSETDHSSGFPPIARRDAKILILGSLPGVRSIRDGEYYAHPQNAFWRIMDELFGVSGDYEQRCVGLLERGIAVWDVLASSVRPGSLDASIDMKSAKANDFETFLTRYAGIERICFNGQTAAKIYTSRVLPKLSRHDIQSLILPSTSPAHASMSLAEKTARWRNAMSLTSMGTNA